MTNQPTAEHGGRRSVLPPDPEAGRSQAALVQYAIERARAAIFAANNYRRVEKDRQFAEAVVRRLAWPELVEALTFIAYECGQIGDGAPDAHPLARDMTNFQTIANRALAAARGDSQ